MSSAASTEWVNPLEKKKLKKNKKIITFYKTAAYNYVVNK